MTTSAAASPPVDDVSGRGPPSARDLLQPAGLALVVALLASLRPLVGSELRYALAAREMVDGGDWVVPHLGGVPYMEKPILFYWLAAGARALFGAAPVALRLPSVLGCVGLLVVAYAFAHELRGRAFARGALLLLIGTLGVVPGATSLTTDSLFAGTLAVAWYALWRHVQRPEGPAKWAFWTALALAFLTKGPLAVALVGASGLVLAVAERRVRPLMRLGFVREGLLFLAIAAPWHVALWQRDPRLVDFFYVRQNVRAAVDGQVNHAGPLWYYVPVLVGLLFPFSVLVVTAVARGVHGLWRGTRNPDAQLLRFLAASVIGPVLLLSASGSKLGTYVMPILPFLGVLVAVEAVRALDRRGRLLRVATAVPAGAIVVGSAVGIPRLLRRYDVARFDPLYVPMVGVALLALVTGLLLSAWLGWCGRRKAFAPMGAGLALMIALVLPVAVDPGARFDAREAARAVLSELAPEDLVVVAGGEIMDYSIPLELGRRVALLGRAREMGMGHFVAHRGPEHPIPHQPTDVTRDGLPDDPWLHDENTLAAAWQGGGRVWLFGDEEDVALLRRACTAAIYETWTDGKHHVYSNLPSPGSRPVAPGPVVPPALPAGMERVRTR